MLRNYFGHKTIFKMVAVEKDPDGMDDICVECPFSRIKARITADGELTDMWRCTYFSNKDNVLQSMGCPVNALLSALQEGELKWDPTLNQICSTER